MWNINMLTNENKINFFYQFSICSTCKNNVIFMQDCWRDFISMSNSKTTEWISLTSNYFHKHYHTSTGDWYKYFMWGKDITLAGICGGKKWKKKVLEKGKYCFDFFQERKSTVFQRYVHVFHFRCILCHLFYFIVIELYITHWGRFASILQPKCSSAFLKKICIFWFKFHSNIFSRVQTTIIYQHWFR